MIKKFTHRRKESWTCVSNKEMNTQELPIKVRKLLITYVCLSTYIAKESSTNIHPPFTHQVCSIPSITEKQAPKIVIVK